jgi:hypothetical protein
VHRRFEFFAGRRAARLGSSRKTDAVRRLLDASLQQLCLPWTSMMSIANGIE